MLFLFLLQNDMVSSKANLIWSGYRLGLKPTESPFYLKNKGVLTFNSWLRPKCKAKEKQHTDRPLLVFLTTLSADQHIVCHKKKKRRNYTFCAELLQCWYVCQIFYMIVFSCFISLAAFESRYFYFCSYIC